MPPYTHLDMEMYTMNNPFDMLHIAQTGQWCTPIFENKDDCDGRNFLSEREGPPYIGKPLGYFLFYTFIGHHPHPNYS